MGEIIEIYAIQSDAGIEEECYLSYDRATAELNRLRQLAAYRSMDHVGIVTLEVRNDPIFTVVARSDLS